MYTNSVLFKDQSVSAVQGNNRNLLWKSHKTHKCTTWQNATS